ncbi:MAG: hypothetical protein RIM84_00290 [Alphaproteobacteria bacterium]
MRMGKFPALIATLLACGMLFAGPAQAARAVALILDLNGGAKPELEPFSEMAANDSVTLADGASITFLHYGTCEEVVVEGGVLVLTERNYLSQKGKIVSVTRAKCPKKVALAGEARTGGVRLRAGSAGLKLNTKPSFVLTGTGREGVTEVVLMHDGKEVGRQKMQGAKLVWSGDALSPGRGYSLSLMRGSGESGEPIDFEVREGEQGLALIEVN